MPATRTTTFITADDAGSVHAIDRLAEVLRQPLHRLIAASRRSTLAVLRGRTAEALALARTAREIGDRGQEPDADAVYWAQALAVWQQEGLPAEDLERTERILRTLVAGSTLASPHAAGLVLLCLATGRPEEARAHFDAIARRGLAALPHDMVRTWTLTQLALACIAFEDRQAADALYRELLPSAGRCAVAAGAVACSGAIDHYLGLLARCAGRPDDAAAHLDRGAAPHARMGAPAPLARSRQALADLRGAAPQPPGRPRLDRRGDLWTVRFDGRSSTVRDVVGLHYLAALLGAPGREVSALHLARLRGNRGAGRLDGAAGLRADSAGPGHEVLDAQARAAYRARLTELRTELDEAEAWNDGERAARLRAELEFVARELAAALGRGGRPRAVATDAERARVSVTRALRAAIDRIARVDPAAGAHLDAAVRTGSSCCYHPERAGRAGS